MLCGHGSQGSPSPRTQRDPGGPAWEADYCVSPWPLQLQVGVEFEASTRMQDTSVSFGYQLDLPKANLLFKGTHLGFPAWKQGIR